MAQNLRFPPIKPDDLSKEQKEGYDQMSDMAELTFGKNAFTYKTKEDAFVGPFGPLLETPEIIKPYLELTSTVGKVGKLAGLPPVARETVILATGSHYKAVYEIYAHERVALAQTDLSKEQINQIKVGKKPSDLDEDCSVAFDAAIELVTKPGPLKKETYDRLTTRFGKKGTLAVIHYVALYAYTCVLLNGTDAPIPEGEKLFD